MTGLCPKPFGSALVCGVKLLQWQIDTNLHRIRTTLTRTHPLLHRFCSRVVRICTGRLCAFVSETNMHRICATFSLDSSDSAPALLQSHPDLHRCVEQIWLPMLIETKPHRIRTAFASKPSGFAPLWPKKGADLHRRALCRGAL